MSYLIFFHKVSLNLVKEHINCLYVASQTSSMEGCHSNLVFFVH